MKTRQAAFVLLVSLPGGLGSATAQAAAPAGTAPSQEEPITLLPFEVTTSSDVGYTAKDTLSGSRLNTSLKDVALRNVLNRDGLLVQRALTTGEPAVFTIQEPRRFILTNTFSF